MSNRNYVKLVFTDKVALSEFGTDLAKLSFVLTREWAALMSKLVVSLLEQPEELAQLSDEEIVEILIKGSEESLSYIYRGVYFGSGNDAQASNIITGLIRKLINNKEEMLAVLNSRATSSAAIALQHNYPYILMKIGNVSDIEYALHFDLHTFETFFVKENNLESVIESLQGFPLSAEDRELLSVEDFYNSLDAEDTLEAANDEEYGMQDDPSIPLREIVPDPYTALLKQFENMHLSRMADTEAESEGETGDVVHDELVEETQEIEYAARVFTIFGELEDERVGHAGQLESLTNWAVSLAQLDGLRYDIVRVTTTTRVSVREESIIA
jgi:hypothetical protein